MALLTCENAAFAYDGKLCVEGLNFEVNAGDYLCIVGENGSGKSTLIKGILNLKQPVSGRVYAGDNLHVTEIGYLPQQTAVSKDFPASVFEVVLSGRLNSRGLLPFYSKRDKEIANENISKLKIENLRNECYRELSGGQQQRALLARALCATKKLLLLDEPTSGLDPAASNELYGIIRQLNRENKITIIMVSHDIHGAIGFASHILHLRSRQLFYGTKEDYINSEAGKKFLRRAGEDDGFLVF
ncbi:MAG: metal ABC transporter ATP-binding protein [Clostridiales bacterium]|jgi:zinc transport system ATP-binding protein|nr:metal ABC transporter ATP-binding protein [Clostridiales bacterium]